MDKFQAFEAWAKCFRQVGIALQPLASIGLPAGLQFLEVFLDEFQQSRVVGERIVRFRDRMRRILIAGSIDWARGSLHTPHDLAQTGKPPHPEFLNTVERPFHP